MVFSHHGWEERKQLPIDDDDQMFDKLVFEVVMSGLFVRLECDRRLDHKQKKLRMIVDFVDHKRREKLDFVCVFARNFASFVVGNDCVWIEVILEPMINRFDQRAQDPQLLML